MLSKRGQIRFLHYFFALLLPGVHAFPSLQAETQVGYESLIVYKSPTCGCCTKWVEHAETAGFETEIQHRKSLDNVKRRYQINPRHQACHTTVSSSGYVFEGHIPAKFIQRFLQEKPSSARGLIVPGMPTGSPGMEYGNQFSPYQIMMIMEDGPYRLYSSVTQQQEQY